MGKHFNWVIAIALALGLVFGLMCLSGWLVMLLWNTTLPTAIVGFQPITFWQAVGIDTLVSLLFCGSGIAKLVDKTIEKK